MKPFMVRTLGNSCGFGPQNNSRVFKVGIPIRLSVDGEGAGGDYDAAIQCRRGLEMLSEWVSTKGGIKVGSDELWGMEVLMMDDLSSEEQVKNITLSFTNDIVGGSGYPVDVVLAPLVESLVEVSIDVTENAGKVLLSGSPDASPYFVRHNLTRSFQFFPSPEKRLETLRAYVTAGAQSVFYVCTGKFCEFYSTKEGHGAIENSEGQVRNVTASLGLGLAYYEVFNTASLHEGSTSDLNTLLSSIQSLDADVLVIDTDDQLLCKKILEGICGSMPKGVYITDCGQNFDILDKYKGVTTWGSIDFDASYNSSISGYSPESWLAAYIKQYVAPVENIVEGMSTRLLATMAMSTFTLGEILVNSIERLQDATNSADLAQIIGSSSFSTLISEAPVSFSEDHKILDVDLHLVQNYGNGRIGVASDSSLVYPMSSMTGHSSYDEGNKTIYQNFIAFILSGGIAIVASLLLGALFFAIAFWIKRMRLNLDEDEKREVVQLKFIGHCLGFSARGFGFGSEFFLVLDLISWGENLSVAVILFARALHPILAIWYLYKIFGNKIRPVGAHGHKGEKNSTLDEPDGDHQVYAISKLIYEDRMLKANKFYSFVLFTSVCDVQGLSLLPWRNTPFTEASDGLPNLAMTRRIIGVTIIQSITVTSVQLSYLSSAFLRMSKGERALFIMNAIVQISIVAINAISYVTKVALLNQRQKDLDLASRNETIARVLAGRKLTELQSYKDNPDEFMKNLNSLFEVRKSIALTENEIRSSLAIYDVGEEDADDDNDKAAGDDYPAYQRKKSVFEARKSRIIDMLTLLDEEDGASEEETNKKRVMMSPLHAKQTFSGNKKKGAVHGHQKPPEFKL